MVAYIALFSALLSRLIALACGSAWVTSFIVCFCCCWISTEVVHLQRWYGWCHMKLLPSWHFLWTPYTQATYHFMQSYICKVHACLAVTCYLHFWQNDRDLVRATAVTRGCNGYWSKSAQKADPGEGSTPARVSNPRPFDHESVAPPPSYLRSAE